MKKGSAEAKKRMKLVRSRIGNPKKKKKTRVSFKAKGKTVSFVARR